MKEYDLFPTTIWSTELDLDLDVLRKEVEEFKSRVPSCQKSNQGGYQGAPFDYTPLSSAIKENTPKSDKEMGDLFMYSWVNINPRGTYNSRHNHMESVTFLSGVYYITVPKGDCGRLIFHDPRGYAINSVPESFYYRDASIVASVPPKENVVYYFPTWLEHEVGVNNTNEDRISVSFNLMRRNDAQHLVELLNST